MSNNSKLSKLDCSNISVTSEELDATRRALLNASFELLEIKHIENDHVSETWRQSETNRTIIIEIDHIKKIDPPATLQNVVDELVDLWIELRAIRNNTVCQYEDEDCLLFPRKPSTAIEAFWKSVEVHRAMRTENPDAWAFLFNSGIDEYVCAYNELEPTDQRAITH